MVLVGFGGCGNTTVFQGGERELNERERCRIPEGFEGIIHPDGTKELRAIPEKADMVNYPPHYTRGKIEAIDGLESAVEGLQGKEAGLTWQVMKYMWRWKFKGSPLEDLKKAEFYLGRLINILEVNK